MRGHGGDSAGAGSLVELRLETPGPVRRSSVAVAAFQQSVESKSLTENEKQSRRQNITGLAVPLYSPRRLVHSKAAWTVAGCSGQGERFHDHRPFYAGR